MDKKTQALVGAVCQKPGRSRFWTRRRVQTIKKKQVNTTVFSGTNLKTSCRRKMWQVKLKREKFGACFKSLVQCIWTIFFEVILLNDRANILYDVLEIGPWALWSRRQYSMLQWHQQSPLSEETKARLLAIVSTKNLRLRRRLVEKIDGDLIGGFVIKAKIRLLTRQFAVNCKPLKQFEIESGVTFGN